MERLRAGTLGRFGAMLLSWTIAVTARAEPPERAVLDDSRVASIRSELEAALELARARGLPTEWLLDKIAEGLAKHVPPGRIPPAVQTLLTRIEAAARVTKQLPKPAEPAARSALLRAATEALAVGAPEHALVGLGRAVAEGGGSAADVRAGMVSVAELGERGFAGSTAVDAVRTAFERAGTEGWPTLLAQARGIDAVGEAARAEALRDVAARLTTLPAAGGSSAVPERVGPSTRPSGPPHDVSFGRRVAGGPQQKSPGRPPR